MKLNKIKSVLLTIAVFNVFIGCSGWETVSLQEYKKVDQLRGQPGEICVRTSDSKFYLFSHSNYYIKNDTLFGKGYLLKNDKEILFEGEFVLTNIESIQYNYEIEKDVEVYYDPEKDSIVGYI